jgi:drug/metabolite transporter (DMT)-like permease
MTLVQLAATLACVAAISGGQVLFKLAARAGDASSAGFPWDVVNAWLIAALVVYGAATLMWVWLLKSLPLNVAYPFVGLAFVIVPMLAAFTLGEALDWRNVAGGVLIAAGVAVSSWR